jgi:hypothetical protein
MIEILRTLADWLEDRSVRTGHMTGEELCSEIDECRKTIGKKAQMLDVILTFSPRLAENRQQLAMRNRELYSLFRRITTLLTELNQRMGDSSQNEGEPNAKVH